MLQESLLVIEFVSIAPIQVTFSFIVGLLSAVQVVQALAVHISTLELHVHVAIQLFIIFVPPSLSVAPLVAPPACVVIEFQDVFAVVWRYIHSHQACCQSMFIQKAIGFQVKALAPVLSHIAINLPHEYFHKNATVQYVASEVPEPHHQHTCRYMADLALQVGTQLLKYRSQAV